jgi:hypothetical protein
MTEEKGTFYFFLIPALLPAQATFSRKSRMSPFLGRWHE